MDHDRIAHIFKYLEYDNLTEWEDDFILSVSEQYEQKQSLTDRQIEVLESVFRKAADRTNDEMRW